MDTIQKEKSTYGKFLPPLFTSGQEGDFFARFLMIFEKTLTRSNAYFSFAEFTSDSEKKIETLCQAIKNGGYELGTISSDENTANWLNEVIRIPDLFDKILARNPDLQLSNEIKGLVAQTKGNRKPPFSELPVFQQNAIIWLNRSVIEIAYPDKTPQSAKSLSDVIDRLSSYFYPNIAPAGFLDWIASWVGLILKEDWDEEKKRKAIAQIIPLYRMRGTKTGLAEYLNIYTNGGVSVTDYGLFSVGINSQVGINTAIDAIDYFVVEVKLPKKDWSIESFERQKMIVESIIEREKPIHTRYMIIWSDVQTLQIIWEQQDGTIGGHSKVGIDTLLWNNQ